VAGNYADISKATQGTLDRGVIGSTWYVGFNPNTMVNPDTAGEWHATTGVDRKSAVQPEQMLGTKEFDQRSIGFFCQQFTQLVSFKPIEQPAANCSIEHVLQTIRDLSCCHSSCHMAY
jgi:hypothetical protein